MTLEEKLQLVLQKLLGAVSFGARDRLIAEAASLEGRIAARDARNTAKRQ